MLKNMKKFTLVTFVFIIGGLLVACGNNDTQDNPTTQPTTREDITPEISGFDKVFYSTPDFDVTYLDMYNSLKVNDGIHQLLAMVDRDILSDYILEVTETEIDEKILELTYSTTDPDEIAEMTEDERTEAIETFENNMYLRGYEKDNYDKYFEIVIAREKYVTDLMLSDDSIEETWHVGPKEIASYYDRNYDNITRTIKIKFNSESDANAVLRSYNLITKNSQLMLYTGTTPISEMPSFAFDETNTRVLSETEILGYYIKMYNDVYGGFKTELALESTYQDLLSNDDLIVDYNDVIGFNSSLANYIFSTLNNYTDYNSGENLNSYYSYKPEKFFSGRDTAYYLILNLEHLENEEVKDFEGTKADLIQIIGEDKYQETEQELIDKNINLQNFVNIRVAELRNEHNLAIYDKYLEMDYKVINDDYVEALVGSKTLIASYDDKDITTDEFLTEALNNNAAMYLINAVSTKALINAHYEDVYCLDTAGCSYNYEINESAKMIEHREAYEQMESQFSESMYSTFYTFEEYLYLAYGVTNKEELFREYYLKQTLQPLFIFDQIMSNDYEVLNEVLDLMTPYYENYFSLDASHLLIYLDRDENGMPDEYFDFYEDLEDTLEFDNIISAFEVEIRNYLADEDNSFSTLVDEYKQATRNDETWGEFKSYGLFIMTENLSSTGSLTYSSVINKYEQPFVDRLVELYQEYNLSENINKATFMDSELLETSFGLHIIETSKGSAFEMPSAKFTMTYNDESEALFTEGSENTSDYISLEQLKLYAMYRFSIITFGSIDLIDSYGFTRPMLPESLIEALDEFASSLHDGLYVIGYLNVALIDNLLEGELVNQENSYYNQSAEDLALRLNNLSDIYFRQVFLELDLR